MSTISPLGDASHGARIYVLRPDAGWDPGEENDMIPRRHTRSSGRPTPPAVADHTGAHGFGSGQQDAYFLTVLMQVQKQLGEISASLQALTAKVDSTALKVEDLMAWKNKILGGAIVLGAISTFTLALLGIGFKMFYDSARIPPAPPTSIQTAPAGNHANSRMPSSAPGAR